MSFAEAWRRAGEEEDKFEPPTGAYKVKIMGGSAFTSRAGDDYAKVDLQILEGDHAGRRFEHFMGFGHEVGARINREALIAYGLRNPEEIGDIEDLHDAIEALEGTEANVSVSYRNDYMQVKVHGSRPPEPVSDIPTSPSGFERTPEQEKTFADAAKNFGTEPAF